MGVGYALKRRRGLLAATLAVLVVGGGLLAASAALFASGEWMARLLTPPPYSNSVRFNFQREVGGRFVVETTEYSTPDPPATVIAAFGPLYGGFALVGNTYQREVVGYNVLNALALADRGNPLRPS